MSVEQVAKEGPAIAPSGSVRVATSRSATGSRSRRNLRWRARLVLGVFGLILALLMAEVSLRVLGPRVPVLSSLTSIATFQTYHPVYGFFHRPGAAGWIHTPEFTSFVTINSRGLREREIEPAKPAGAFRVLVLGDSFVEGAQVGAEATAARRLETLLQENARQPIQVINAGNAGFGTSQELLFLEHDGRAYSPDVVVLVFFIDNDLVDNGYAAARRQGLNTTRRPFFVPDGRGGLELRPPTPPPPDMFADARVALRRSLVFNLVENVALAHEARDQEQTAGGKNRSTYAGAPDPEWLESWEVTEAVLGRVRATTEEMGAQLVVVAAPSFFQVDDEAWRRNIWSSNCERQRCAIDAPNRRLQEIADRQGIRLLDLLPTLRSAVQSGSRLYYPDDGHWTPEGHAFAAGQIADYLRSASLIPTR